MTDLTDFLLARIAEDEEAARAAAPAPWSCGDIESVAGGSLYDPGVMIASIHWDNVGEQPQPIHRFRSEEQADATGEHIARWDPARVLAECGAKRRILEMHKPYRRIYGLGCDVCLHPRRLTVDVDGWPCPTLRLLALPYADHPDYRDEWRP